MSTENPKSSAEVEIKFEVETPYPELANQLGIRLVDALREILVGEILPNIPTRDGVPIFSIIGLDIQSTRPLYRKPIITETLCPLCDKPMIARTNRQTGSKFWGCSDYPNCKGTRDSLGRSKEEYLAEKEQERRDSAPAPKRWEVR